MIIFSDEKPKLVYSTKGVLPFVLHMVDLTFRGKASPQRAIWGNRGFKNNGVAWQPRLKPKLELKGWEVPSLFIFLPDEPREKLGWWRGPVVLASTGLFLLWDKASFQYCAHSREKLVSWRVYTKGIRGTGFRARLSRVVGKLPHLHFKCALNTSGISLSPTLKWFSAAIKQRSPLVLAVLWFLLFCPRQARDTQWLWKNKASHETTENTLQCRVNHKTNKQTKAL